MVRAQLSVQSKGSSKPTQYFLAQWRYVHSPLQVLMRTDLCKQHMILQEDKQCFLVAGNIVLSEILFTRSIVT